MTKLLYGLLYTILLALFAGCATDRNLFVLLPDDDGQVGEIVVSNSAGSQTLATAEQGISVASAVDKPQAPKQVNKNKIESIFGNALAAQPQPPMRFILYFAQGSTKLDAQSKKLIPEILAAIEKRDSFDTSVIGHTDTKGSKKYNLDLSSRRAKAIAKLLVAKNINSEILEIASHGEGNPLIKTGDNVTEKRNRRVEVTVR